jgi:hypothetical protein
MRLKEKLHRRMNPLAGTVPYDLLNHDFPNLEQGTPWTVWVNPKEFSLADYQRIVVLLGQHAHEMCLQQLAFEADSTKNPHAWLRFPGLLIWRTVYHDYSLLKNTMFERTKGKTEEQVTITPFGAVEYRQKSERYQYGFGCGLGELSENADTLFVNPYWPTFDVTFPISEFAQFKNEQGQALTDVYKVILSAEN